MAVDTRKVVVLCSGGLDSIVTAEMYRRTGYDVSLLYIDYGNDNAGEEAEKVKAYGVKHNLKLYGELLQTDFLKDAIKASPSYIPMRNLMFISIALSLAETIGAGAVALGIIEVSQYYSDCSEQFINSMNNLGLNMADIQVLTPLINATKKDVVSLANCFGIAMEDIFTCEHPNEDGSACGKCDKCYDLQQAQNLALN